MSSRPSIEQELSSLASNIAPLIILLIFVVLSLVWVVWFPWGPDPLYSSLHHFLTLFPFVLLAILTYVARKKVAEGEGEPVGAGAEGQGAGRNGGTRLPRLATAEGAFRYLIALMLATTAAIGLLLVFVALG